jgi:hypothetical protein
MEREKMRTTLGGSLMVCDGLKFDYCFIEAIQCLLDLCDQVSVVAFTPGDIDLIRENFDGKIKLKIVPREQWDVTRGRERLNYWTNVAKAELDTRWHINLQADEIVHENCFSAVREAISEKTPEAFLSWRLNLWGDPYHVLTVPQHRKPCSDEIVRLAKLKYSSYGDAESLNAPYHCDYVKKIRIYHMGFVRKKDVMKSKIINMQETVFELGYHDPKLDGMEKYDPWAWFSPEDVQPIPEELPRYIQAWAKERV